MLKFLDSLNLYRSRTFFCRPCNGVLLCILEARHLEIVRQLKVCFRISLKGIEIYKKGILDGKNGIVVDVLARSVEDLSNNRFVPWRSELR